MNPFPQRRSTTVTFLSIGIVVVAALNLVRAIWLWLRISLLTTLPLTAPLWLLIAASIVAALVWGAAGIGLWRLASWSRWLALAFVVLYHAYNWIIRWQFEVSDYARLTRPWNMIITVVSISLTWIILWRPNVRSQFDPILLR